MTPMRTGNAVCGAVALLLGVIIAVEARRIPDPGIDVIGPGAFPFGLGLILAACGAALCLMALNRARLPDERPHPARWVVLGAAVALLAAYTQGLAQLGFVLATALFVAICLALLGERGPVRLGVAGVAVSLAIFIIFGLLLGVDLPKGPFFAG
jgi:putative tricarboxylic transport membrane protein